MKNELQSLSNLISLPITKHYVNHEQRKLEFKYECNIIKDMILQKVFASDCQLKITHYIRYHHKELIGLMDRFYLMCTDVVMPESFLHPMDELRHYIEFHFKDYLDLDINISQFTLAEFQQELELKKQQLARVFRRNEINPALINVLLAHFKKLENQQQMNHVAYNYHLLFISELERFALKKIKRSHSDQLYIVLGRLNFNDMEFMAHCRNQIFEKVQKTDRKESKLDILANYFKKIRMIQVKPNLSYNKDYPMVTEVLCNWLTEERAFIESRKVKSQTALKELRLEEKIEVGLSVSQLALLVKVLVEEGILAKTNMTRLFSFFTTFFRTSNSAQISSDSFRNNYYHAESGTVSSLKGRVIGLINVLNRMK